MAPERPLLECEPTGPMVKRGMFRDALQRRPTEHPRRATMTNGGSKCGRNHCRCRTRNAAHTAFLRFSNPRGCECLLQVGDGTSCEEKGSSMLGSPGVVDLNPYPLEKTEALQMATEYCTPCLAPSLESFELNSETDGHLQTPKCTPGRSVWGARRKPPNACRHCFPC
jgi:hypothetical protein